MKRRIVALLALLVLGLAACSLPGVQPKEAFVERNGYMLDTVLNIRLYGWEDENTLTALMEEIARLESLLSVERAGSDIDRLTKAAGREWVNISPECEEVLRRAKEVYTLSEGHFDVTAGPLIDLWGIRGEGEGAVPTAEALQAAQAKVSSERLLVEPGRAYLTEVGMKVNLGAIAKGYIADCVKRFLQEAGVEHALINLGGNVLLLGAKPNGEPYHIGVNIPFSDRSEIWGELLLTDQSAVTAGIDERYFEKNGKRYHHILDPFTGYPADTAVAAVTILSKESVMGDALSTTCLLLGVEKGLQLIESLPDTEAIFLLQDGGAEMSGGFEDYIFHAKQK